MGAFEDLAWLAANLRSGLDLRYNGGTLPVYRLAISELGRYRAQSAVPALVKQLEDVKLHRYLLPALDQIDPQWATREDTSDTIANLFGGLVTASRTRRRMRGRDEDWPNEDGIMLSYDKAMPGWRKGMPGIRTRIEVMRLLAELQQYKVWTHSWTPDSQDHAVYTAISVLGGLRHSEAVPLLVEFLPNIELSPFVSDTLEKIDENWHRHPAAKKILPRLRSEIRRLEPAKSEFKPFNFDDGLRRTRENIARIERVETGNQGAS